MTYRRVLQDQLKAAWSELDQALLNKDAAAEERVRRTIKDIRLDIAWVDRRQDAKKAGDQR